MSFLDKLREERQAPMAVYHQFVLIFPQTKDDIHAFFEGRDDPSFYCGILSRVVQDGKQIHTYICNNKDAVYQIYLKVSQLENNSHFVLFFVDKDYSDLLEEEYAHATNIYTTEYYSIENYLVTEIMLRRVLNDFLGSVTQIANMEKIVEKFRIEHERFLSYMLPVSGWIVFTSRRGLKPNFNNVKLSELYTFNSEFVLQALSLSEIYAYLERNCGVECPLDQAFELPTVISELEKLEPKRYVRGKYELWFFVKFIGTLVEKLREECQDLEEKVSVRIRTQITEANAVEILGPRVQIPESIRNFLQVNGL